MNTTKLQSRPSTIVTGRVDALGPRNKPRRAGLLAFACLLIAGSALGGGVLFSRAGDTSDVLAVRDGVAKGHTITRGDLVSKKAAGVDGTYAADAAASVIGETAAVDLVPGQILTQAMVADSPTPGVGEASVGLNLDPANVPSAGLQAGDRVDVIAVPSGQDATTSTDDLDVPTLLAPAALVFEVTGSATEGGGVLVTLIVDKSAASRIAAYSTAHRVAIVETSAGDGGAS